MKLTVQSTLFLVFLGCISVLAGCKGSSSNPLLVLPPSNQKTTIVSTAVSAVAEDGQVTLAWSAVPGAVHYDVYSSLSSTQKGSKIASLSGTTYSDSSVTNDITYYYVVDAFTAEGMIGTSSQVSATPTAPTGSVVVFGNVHFQDKEYGVKGYDLSGHPIFGFTGIQPLKPVRYAAVELVTDNGIVTAQTDSLGYYSINTSPTATVYTRVLAEATPPGCVASIGVQNLSGNGYAVRGNDLMLSGNANVNIYVAATSIGGAFNIMDVFTSGFEFIRDVSGTYPSSSLTGYWQTGSTKGTYYCTGTCSAPGNGIYVLSTLSDTDEYDDDVLYHEFGHFAADHFSKDDSPGGNHYLTDPDLDMRLTWSEGWGDFMPGAIKSWAAAKNQVLLSSSANIPLSAYVDTYGTSGWSFDIGSTALLHSTNEIAVANVLWQVLNADSFGLQPLPGLAPIWSVISSGTFTERSPYVNVESFWDAWTAANPGDQPALHGIFLSHGIDYSDLYSAPSFSSATVIDMNAPQIHNLYPAEAEFVTFNADQGARYTVMTSYLLNGADTMLELFSADSLTTHREINDNANMSTSYATGQVPSDVFPWLCETTQGPCHENRSDILGSSISFTADRSGPWYVKITSSPYRPVSAGRYGTYTLTITSP